MIEIPDLDDLNQTPNLYVNENRQQTHLELDVNSALTSNPSITTATNKGDTASVGFPAPLKDSNGGVTSDYFSNATGLQIFSSQEDESQPQVLLATPQNADESLYEVNYAFQEQQKLLNSRLETKQVPNPLSASAKPIDVVHEFDDNEVTVYAPQDSRLRSPQETAISEFSYIRTSTPSNEPSAIHPQPDGSELSGVTDEALAQVQQQFAQHHLNTEVSPIAVPGLSSPNGLIMDVNYAEQSAQFPVLSMSAADNVIPQAPALQYSLDQQPPELMQAEVVDEEAPNDYVALLTSNSSSNVFKFPNRTKESPILQPPPSAMTLQTITLTNDSERNIRRSLASALKKPVEYTMHIVFTQFVKMADVKLDLCMNYPQNDDPPVMEVLGEGVDPKFDKVIAALGYISRRKPGPIVDVMMQWRSRMNEDALQSSGMIAEVDDAKRASVAYGDLENNDATMQNGSLKKRRSMSLMRSKSHSKFQNSSKRDLSSNSAIQRNNLSLTSNEIVSIERQAAKIQAVKADRRSLSSVFLLCRVLIEIVKQTSIEDMGVKLCDKLEEMAYIQLKISDPILTSRSLVRSANWNLCTELLGYMSDKRFLSVSDRFVADLEKVPAQIKHEDEPRYHLLIQGMKYLKLKNDSLEKFEECSEFFLSLAKFFERSRNEAIIFAYCDVLGNLLLPLANILTAETNHPTWVEAMERIYNKAYKIWHSHRASQRDGSGSTSSHSSSNNMTNSSMINNVFSFSSYNGWTYSMHLMTAVLVVSRKELFSETWLRMIEDNSSKLKVKVPTNEKTTFVICIARLLWVYVYRLPDSLNNTVKRLDSLFDMLFFNPSVVSKKNQWITFDMYLINGLEEVIKVVGYHHLNYVLDNVLIKLLKFSFSGTLENLSAEKIILVIRSYLSILEDCELGNKPLFPTDEELGSRVFKYSSTGSRWDESRSKNNAEDQRNTIRLNEFMFLAKNANNSASHEEICRSFACLLKLLDTECGLEVPKQGNRSHSNSLSKNPSIFNFGIDFSYVSKNLQYEVFANLIHAVPWTMVPVPGESKSIAGIPFKQVVDILTRNVVHSDERVSNAAITALKRLASRKNPTTLITTYAKIAFQFSERPDPSYDYSYTGSNEFHRLLKIYVELLNCWLQQFNDINECRKNIQTSNPLAQEDEVMNHDVLNDLYQINHKIETSAVDAMKFKPSDDLEWKQIITVIEEIEGNGLFFLCSQDFSTRYQGLSILKLVERFDQVIFEITDNNNDLPSSSNEDKQVKQHSRSSSKFAADVGTRLANVLQDVDFFELLKPIRRELSNPERQRLTKFRNRKNMLIRLAESDHGLDTTVWFRIFPRLLDIFFERCPMPVAMCRSIVCVRLVQMHEQVLEFSDSYRTTSSFFSKPTTPPEVLINQWKIYLIFACCSLTSTSEQRIAIPTKPSHGRKKSMQMYIQHQKITSAKSIFRMMIPFLKTLLSMVRDAVVTGLSSININIFQTLLENAPASLNEWGGQANRDVLEDRLRIGLVQILSNITRKFVSEPFIFDNEWIIEYLVKIVKTLKTFLSIPAIQISVEFQRLRRFWCTLVENVFKGLQQSLDVDRWFPFEARLGCYTYLHEWCGYGESSRTAEERYSTMLTIAIQEKDATSAAAILEVEKKALQFASLSCMTSLCSSPISQLFDIPGTTALMSFDIPALMFWIHSLFCSRDERICEIGKNALHNVLVSNINNSGIIQHIVRECYVSQESTMNSSLYIVTFIETILEHKEFSEISLELLCLTNLLIGHDNYDVRFAAIRLLVRMEVAFYSTSTATLYMEGVCSRTRLVYKRALFEVSGAWANAHPESCYEVISYFSKFFNLVGISNRKDISSCLLPWIQLVDLKYLPLENDKEDVGKLDIPSSMVLHNLFEIVVKFSWELPNEIQALWIALGTKPLNYDIILDFIMESCLVRKSPQFVEYARQINDYLVFSQADINFTIDKYINNLQTKSMVPRQCRTEEIISGFKIESDLPYIADIQEIIPYNEKDAIFSMGQLSMIFLVDLFTVRSERMVENLPLLLQVSFSLLDHYIPIVQEAAVSLLVQLVHTLAPDEPKSAEVTTMLRKREPHKDLWLYDDLTNDNKGTRTPKSMDHLARSILEIFSSSVPTLQNDWGRVSLNWATTCAVRHIACRSFQLFRSLLSFLDQRMLKDMLHRLSNTISDESVDIQGFAIQILMTLNAITAELKAESLINFPQLFWVSVACLSTIHEQEFIEVLSTMSKFLSKIDLDSPDTISCLISAFPMKWEGRFDGLQNIILTGLRSGTSWNVTIKFLDKLNTLNDSDIIGVGDGRLIMSVASNLPRFLHALEQKTISKDVYEAAVQLANLAEQCHKPALARILTSMSKNRFRSKKDFLVQTLATIKSNFFPQYEAQVLVLLLGLLLNTIPWVKLETLALLKQVFPLVDLQRDEFVGVGADLIFPLLRLLYTDYAEQALEVLDEVVAIPGSKLDPSFLRVSIGDNDTKKEYEQTATLFGLPDENGWSIPMPSTTTNRTRSNVHAVFTTCEVTTVNDDGNNNKDEEIEFHMEDFYEPRFEYADNFSVGVEEPDASLSHMWAALDDFDSFFTKETDNLPVTSPRRDPHMHFRGSSMSSNETISPIDSVPQIYDKKVLGMLNKSLARSQSNASFKANLADSMGTLNFSEQNTLVTAKRSYLPFRHSKVSKTKADNFTTPVTQSTATFDQNSSTPIIMASSPPFEAVSDPHQSPARLDFLIGGKKRVKRNSRLSPTHSPVNSSAENLQGMWSSGKQPTTPAGQNQHSGTALALQKARERKRVSQKYK